MELSSTNPITLLPVEPEVAAELIKTYPFYVNFVIPADTYKGVTEPVNTVAVKATFIVRKDLPDDIAYSLVKGVFEGREDIIAGHAKGKELDINLAVTGVSVPFHPGAEKYFKELGVIQ